MQARMPSSTSSQVEISWILARCDNLAPAQKSGNIQFKTKQKLTFKFSTLFTAKDVDFMHFKVFRTENISKWISNGQKWKTCSDIEATRPVLRNNRVPV